MPTNSLADERQRISLEHHFYVAAAALNEHTQSTDNVSDPSRVTRFFVTSKSRVIETDIEFPNRFQVV